MMAWLEKAFALEKAGLPYALVTVITDKGSTPRDAGAKMLVTDDDFFGTIGGGTLEKIALEDARRALQRAASATQKYPLCFRIGQCCGGAVETLIEVYAGQPELYLFGGGHVGQSLCQTLVGTPFRVRLVDERAEWRHHPALPGGVIREERRWQEVLAAESFSAHKSYALVMTHDHGVDLDVVAALIEKPLRFIGLIGSETKWKRFQMRLEDLGHSADSIQRVHCPIGHKRFGKAPKEIAINIASELLDVYYGDQDSSQ